MKSTVMVCAIISASVCCFVPPALGAQKLVRPVAMVKAKLIEMAPNPGILSGTIAVYQFARYRIELVCSGRFAGNEFIAGHLVPLNILVGTKPGDSGIFSISRSTLPLVSPSLAETTSLSRSTDVRWIARPASSVEQKSCQARR